MWHTSSFDEKSGCKGSSEQGMEEAWDNSSMATGRKQKLEGENSRSTKRQKESPLCFIDGNLSPPERGIRIKITILQRQSRTPRWHCERRPWSLRSFYWTGLVCVPNDCRKSHGCHRKIARMWRTSSWRSISIHSQKDGGCSHIAKKPKSECPDVWIRLPPHKWRNPWQTWKIPWYFSNEICMASAYQDFYGKDNSRRFCWNLDGDKFRIGNVFLFIENKD